MNPPIVTEGGRGLWILPFVAALGYSASGLHVYIVGPFMQPLNAEFGWSRAQISAGVTIVNFIAAAGAILLGILVDRFGPRRIGLIGVLSMSGSIALLSTANGTMANWIMLWVLIAVCSIPAQATVWTSMIVKHFDSARGLALAITLSGTALTAMVMPLLATWFIADLGWRAAFAGIGAIWALATFPAIFALFRSRTDTRGASGPAVDRGPVLHGDTVRSALRKPAFYILFFCGGVFSLCVIGSVVHFVPMIMDGGASAVAAASSASLIGIASLLGRLGTGLLLDRFPAHVVGAVAMLLPVPGIACLLIADTGTFGHVAAALLIGFSLGAEFDLITYLAARQFGLANFGKILGALLCAVALGGSVGPMAAGAIFDSFESYRPFLVLIIGLMALCSAAMALLRPVSVPWPAPGEPPQRAGRSDEQAVV